MPKVSPSGTSTKKTGKKGKAAAGGATSAKQGPMPAVPEADAVQQQLPGIFTISRLADGKRRDRCHAQFRDLCELVLATELSTARARTSPDFFPTLQVGFIARAMGLQLSHEDVIHLVSLVEEDTPSQGTVSRTRLEGVVVDAVMTGLVGGPTLAASGVVPEGRLDTFHPIPCVREDEATIFRAFEILDTDQRGYLDEGQLRKYLSGGAEPFGNEEMEEFLLAILDPETNVAYYRDFADILAHE